MTTQFNNFSFNPILPVSECNWWKVTLEEKCQVQCVFLSITYQWITEHPKNKMEGAPLKICIFFWLEKDEDHDYHIYNSHIKTIWAWRILCAMWQMTHKKRVWHVFVENPHFSMQQLYAAVRSQSCSCTSLTPSCRNICATCHMQSSADWAQIKWPLVASSLSQTQSIKTCRFVLCLRNLETRVNAQLRCELNPSPPSSVCLGGITRSDSLVFLISGEAMWKASGVMRSKVDSCYYGIGEVTGSQ